MKNSNFLFILTMLFLLFGCRSEDEVNPQQQNKEDVSNKAEISYSTLDKEKNANDLLEEFKGKNKQLKTSLSHFEVVSSVTIVKLNGLMSYNIPLKPSAEDKKRSVVKSVLIN